MRGFEIPACEEMKDLLEQLGDISPDATTTKARGIIVAKTNLDPFTVIKKVRELIWKNEFPYKVILKLRPIERIVNSNLEEIQQACAELAEKKIDNNQSFRVTLERRFTNIERNDLIIAAASNIDRKVDLNNPDMIVFIEVLEDSAGISILKQADELSILKEEEKRDFKKFEDRLKKDAESAN
jgi:tRNA acetyltransferase TAN1